MVDAAQQKENGSRTRAASIDTASFGLKVAMSVEKEPSMIYDVLLISLAVVSRIAACICYDFRK